ncbi:unnamed protein product [Alternaria sp. RS040]
MSAKFTSKPQQLSFFDKILRRNDSAVALSSASTTSSITLSFASLSQENDQLAQDNAHLQRRNGELTQQSELNQNLFQQTSETLAAKESEITDLEEALIDRDSEITDLKGIQKELKECIRRNDDASNETIHTLKLQLEDLSKQLGEAHDAATKRDVTWTKSKNQQKQHLTMFEGEQQQSQQGPNDFVLIHWTKLHAKDKTIEFLRCRQSKSDKRIARLKVRLAAADELGRNWVQTITLANSKVKVIETKPQVGTEH